MIPDTGTSPLSIDAAENRKKAIKLLSSAKQEEEERQEKLTRVKIRGGYVMTTHPEDYEHLKIK